MVKIMLKMCKAAYIIGLLRLCKFWVNAAI